MGISESISEYFAKRPFPSFLDISSSSVRWQTLSTKFQQAKLVVDSISREGYSEAAGKAAEAKLSDSIREQAKYWGSSPEVKLSTREARDVLLYKYDQAYQGFLAHDPSIVAINEAQGVTDDNVFRDDMIARWRLLDAICAIDDGKASIKQATSGLGNPFWVAAGVLLFVGAMVGAIVYLVEQKLNKDAMTKAIEVACASGQATPACKLAIQELKKSTEEDIWTKVQKYALYGGAAYVIFNIIMARESARFSRSWR